MFRGYYCCYFIDFAVCTAKEKLMEVYGLEACSAGVTWSVALSLMTGPPVLYKTDCSIE